MAKAKFQYFVEGFEGVQRKSDRLYTHAVIGVPDVVGRAESMLAWAKGKQERDNAEFSHAFYNHALEHGVGSVYHSRAGGLTITPRDVESGKEYLAAWPTAQDRINSKVYGCEKDLADARERHAAGAIKAQVISFHSRRDLAEKARDALRGGSDWLIVTVREVVRLV